MSKDQSNEEQNGHTAGDRSAKTPPLAGKPLPGTRPLAGKDRPTLEHRPQMFGSSSPEQTKERPRPADLYDEARQHGLDSQVIYEHHNKIKQALRRGDAPTTFPVVDTCRLDNGRLLAFDRTWSPSDPGLVLSHYVAFTPAAGASSRYTQPLADLIKALAAGDRETMGRSLSALSHYRDVLPEPLHALLDKPELVQHLSPEACQELSDALQVPKALYPCVREGQTFLTLKCFEHESLAGLGGQLFVTPPDMQATFHDHIEHELGPLITKTEFLEQGQDLSTLRFSQQGEPVRDEDGRLSLVPAGHGALIRLFPKTAALFPACHSLWIRNIDNVTGVGPQVQSATIRFLTLHHHILTTVASIRQHLAKADWPQAAAQAKQLSDELGLARPLTRHETDYIRSLGDSAQRELWQLQFQLFQSPVPMPVASDTRAPSSQDALQALYRRPVNTLGQVANTGHDVGGSPVVIESDAGTLSVCLELPHVSADDKKHYYEDPSRATHFNPVFVASELVNDEQAYHTDDHAFWLLAKKTWLGQPVYYVENVLYELLGNSQLANVVFVEIPRFLFNPHKSLDNTVGRSLRDWGIESH